MSSIVRKSLNMSVRGSRLLLIASRSRSITAAANRLPLVQHAVATNTQKTFTRLISVTHPRFSNDSKTEPEAPEVPVIPIELVERIVKDSLVLIDVRDFKEVAEYGKIPTANVLPVDDIETALKLSPDEFKVKYNFEKPLPSDLIITYCRSGKRANRAGTIFRDKFGYKSVVNFKGSWQEWSEKHPEDVKAPLPK